MRAVFLLLFIGLMPTALQAVESGEKNPLLTVPLDQLMSVNSRVENSSQLLENFKEQPQPIIVLSASEIRAFGYRTLAEILNSFPGIYTSTDHAYTYIGSRGMTLSGSFNSRLLVTIDGMQFNDNIYQLIGLAGNEFIIDVDLIDRVEFVPGPGSVSHGNNAFLGVINVITRSSASPHNGELAVSIDNNGEFVRRGTAYMPVNGGHAMVSLTQYDSPGISRTLDTYRNLAGESIPSHVTDSDSDREDNRKLFVKYEKGPLYFNFLSTDRVKHLQTPILDSKQALFFDKWLAGNLNYRLLDTSTAELSTHLFMGSYRSGGSYLFEEKGPLFKDDFVGNWWGIELKGVWRGIRGHQLSAGVNLQENTKQKLYSEGILDTNHQSHFWGVWLEDQFSPWQNGKLIVGGRIDRDAQNNLLASPRFGVVHRMSDSDTLRLNLARNYLSPSEYESRFANASGTLDIKPEQMTSLDLGWERINGIAERFAMSAFAYKAEDSALNAFSYDINGNSMNQIGTIIGKGLQAEFQKTWSTGWRVTTNATYQSVTDEGVGHRVDSPERLYKLQVKSPKLAGVSPAVEAIYIDSRLDRECEKLASSTLVNFSLSRQFDHNLTLRLSAYNLFDTHYQSPVSYDYPMAYINQNGRTIRLKAEWSF